jgi:hypothetical protein
MRRQWRRRTKKEIKCPTCGGTGKISKFVTIDEMSNLQLARRYINEL